MKNEACYNCTERCVGCHTNCEKYNRYRKQLEYIKKQKKLYNEMYSVFNGGSKSGKRSRAFSE